MLIFIDPGHGGVDSGAIGNGLYEKNLTLDISTRVTKLLRDCGFNVAMTRTTDVYVGLSDRANMANQAKADYFLAIHINDSGGGTGFESFVQPGCDYGETGRVRGIIHQAVSSYFTANGMPDRGKKEQDLAVCRETHMPAFLIECGFIDTDTKLSDPNFRQGIAEAVCKGMCEAFNVTYHDPNQVTVQEEQWRIDAMNWLKSQGLINSDHNPNSTPTWAEFGAVLKKLKGGN